MVLIKYSGKYVKIYFNMKITCLSCSRRFCLSSPKVLLPFQGALADLWFSFGCCGNIVNPSSLSLGVVFIPGICFFILRYFLLTLATLGIFLF